MQTTKNHDDIIRISTELAAEVIRRMLKDIIQEALKAELEEMLGYNKYAVSRKSVANSRNGYSRKTLRTRLGPIEINVPRDRKGEFEPRIISRYARSMSDLEYKILNICLSDAVKGDLHTEIAALYASDKSMSREIIMRITDKIAPEVIKWRNLLAVAD